MSGKNDDNGGATGVYLVTPPEVVVGATPLEEFEARLEAAVSGGEVDCVLLSTGGADDATAGPIAARLAPKVQAHDVAFIVEDLPTAAEKSGADGVHLAWDRNAVHAARRQLGGDAIVGTYCGASRHDAMLAGETDCDYVGLESGALELITWWSEIMTIPSVAFGVTAETAGRVATAGADFIGVKEAVWNHPDGPAAAIAALAKSIARP